MSNFKRGDLVMIVKPKFCCGYSNSLGEIFTVINADKNTKQIYSCAHCRFLYTCSLAIKIGENVWIDARRLKKIDPPAEGDSLPKRRDLEIPA